MCGFRSMELMSSFLHARLSAAAVISLASPVVRYCYRALLHFVRSAAIKALPGHIVDVDGLHISHADIFKSQVRAAAVHGSPPPPCQLTVEDGFWNARVCPWMVDRPGYGGCFSGGMSSLLSCPAYNHMHREDII